MSNVYALGVIRPMTVVVLTVLMCGLVGMVGFTMETETEVWLEHVAFHAGDMLDIRINYVDSTGKFIDGDLTIQIDGESYSLKFESPFYAIDLPSKPTGIYDIIVSDQGKTIYESSIFVWERRESQADEDVIWLGDDGYFYYLDGSRFIPLGYSTNMLFAPKPETWMSIPEIKPNNVRGEWVKSSWANADERWLHDWLAYLMMQGINTVRVGVNLWVDIPGDQGGYALESVLERFDDYLSIAGSMGMKVIPVFYWLHYGEFGFRNAEYDKYLVGQEFMWGWFTDENAIRLQKGFIQDFVERFKNDPRIFAWELQNEYPPLEDIRVAEWTNEHVEHIRSLGVKHLIKIDFMPTHGAAMSKFYSTNADMDFYGYAGFPIRDSTSDAGTNLSAHTRYVKTFDKVGIAKAFCRSRGPASDRVYIYTRDSLWMSLLSGAPGIIAWDASEAYPEEYLIISKIVADINWSEFSRKQAPVAVIVDGSGRDLYELMLYDEYFQKDGYDYDVIDISKSNVKSNKYDTVIEMVVPRRNKYWMMPGFELQVPEINAQPRFEISNGYFGTYMLDEDFDVMVFYARNMDGWDEDGFRFRKVEDLDLVINLEGHYCYTVYDLDEREAVSDGEFIDKLEVSRFGTDHDYVVYIEAM